MTRRWWLAALAALLSAACVPASVPARPSTKLLGSDGIGHALVPSGQDQLTVVIFFSADCYCLLAHSERIRRLAAAFAPRGVRFWAVDSEVSATPEHDRAEVGRRGYPFPILLDPGAQVAHALGAAYAGYSVVLNAQGEVLYRGGIDSDCVRLREDRASYLENALSDLLAGARPRLAEGKTLGCVLRTW